MNDFTKLDLSAIKEGEKITIVRQSEMGFLQQIQIKFVSSKLRDWAQYKNCFYIQGRQFRKRKDTASLIRPNQEFVVYRGWINVEKEIKLVSQTDEVTVTSYGMCFDESRFARENDNTLPKIYSTLEGQTC